MKIIKTLYLILLVHAHFCIMGMEEGITKPVTSSVKPPELIGTEWEILTDLLNRIENLKYIQSALVDLSKCQNLEKLKNFTIDDVTQIIPMTNESISYLEKVLTDRNALTKLCAAHKGLSLIEQKRSSNIPLTAQEAQIYPLAHSEMLKFKAVSDAAINAPMWGLINTEIKYGLPASVKPIVSIATEFPRSPGEKRKLQFAWDRHYVENMLSRNHIIKNKYKPIELYEAQKFVLQNFPQVLQDKKINLLSYLKALVISNKHKRSQEEEKFVAKLYVQNYYHEVPQEHILKIAEETLDQILADTRPYIYDDVVINLKDDLLAQPSLDVFRKVLDIINRNRPLTKQNYEMLFNQAIEHLKANWTLLKDYANQLATPTIKQAAAQLNSQMQEQIKIILYLFDILDPAKQEHLEKRAYYNELLNYLASNPKALPKSVRTFVIELNKRYPEVSLV